MGKERQVVDISGNTINLGFYCDEKIHLVCKPYSVENLHLMANFLSLKRCWYHKGNYPHYDIPKKRIEEIKAKCEIIDSKVLLTIIKTHL